MPVFDATATFIINFNAPTNVYDLTDEGLSMLDTPWSDRGLCRLKRKRTFDLAMMASETGIGAGIYSLWHVPLAIGPEPLPSS